MFNPIKSHPNGPGMLDATELGDGWHDAMSKINAMFHHVYHVIEGKPPVAGVAAPSVLGTATTSIDAAANARITELEAIVAKMQARMQQAAPAVADLVAKAKTDADAAAADVLAKAKAAHDDIVAKLRADAQAAEGKLAAALGPQPQSSDDTLSQAVADAAKAAS